MVRLLRIEYEGAFIMLPPEVIINACEPREWYDDRLDAIALPQSMSAHDFNAIVLTEHPFLMIPH